MSNEDRRDAIVAAGRKISARWYAIPAAVFLLGVLAIALFAWTNEIHEKQSANFALANALMELQIKTATAHLWLEEALVRDKDFNSNVRLVQSNLADAVDFLNTILRGGETEHGLVLQPLRVSALQAQAEKISGLMSEFGILAEKRLSQPVTAGPGSESDEHFDRVFTELQGAIKALEIDAERNVVRDYTDSKRIFYGINLAWLLIVVAATAGLGSLAARKERVEDALKNAKNELEVKVAERTRDLGNANDQLHVELAERRRAEEALQESARKFRGLYQQFHVLLDSIPDSITLLSPDLRILWANKGAVVAAKGAEVAGRHCYELWHDTPAPCDGCGVLRGFQTGRTENSQSTAPDGRIWELRAFPMKGDDGRVNSVIELAEDITEKSMLQKQAERMAQLASLGELSAGVAHEINNPVNGIINCAEILMNKTSADSREHELGKRIIREGDRIAYIVKGLLSFSRQESEDMVPAQVRDLLADTLALTEAQMKKEGITLRVDADGEALLVRAQPQRLEQVFLNIINNARDALNEKYPQKHEGKMLSITTNRVATDNGPRVRINFRDQGAGIPANVMSRIMNPFFSTKPRGKGTGLGLSISHGIVENHGGKLTIDSVEGEYANVVVELPLCEG